MVHMEIEKKATQMQGASPEKTVVERKYLFGVLFFFSWCGDVWRGYWVSVLDVLYIAEYL